MTKQRVDALKNKAKVVKAVLENPLKTDREIEKEIGIGKSTVNRVKVELGQTGTKDDRILGICDTDLQNVILGQNILQRRLQEKEEELKIQEIVQIIQEGTKRYTIFKGDITDGQGGLKNITPEDKIIVDNLLSQNL